MSPADAGIPGRRASFLLWVSETGTVMSAIVKTLCIAIYDPDIPFLVPHRSWWRKLVAVVQLQLL